MGLEELGFGVRWCDWDEVIRNVLGEWSSGFERIACRSNWTIRIRERVFKKQTMLFSWHLLSVIIILVLVKAFIKSFKCSFDSSLRSTHLSHITHGCCVIHSNFYFS
jgi:hypothetical protein